MAAEEDIELTESEINTTRLSLMVLAGILADVRDAEPEAFEEWEASCKELVALDEEDNLSELILSALEKFREDTNDEESVGEV